MAKQYRVQRWSQFTGRRLRPTELNTCAHITVGGRFKASHAQSLTAASGCRKWEGRSVY